MFFCKPWPRRSRKAKEMGNNQEMEKRKSTKTTLARRIVLVGALNDSRPRCDDGSPVIGSLDRDRCHSSPMQRTKSDTNVSTTNVASNELFEQSKNIEGDSNEPYTAVGSHEDIHNIGEYSVKKILENFKKFEKNENNNLKNHRISFLKSPTESDRISKISNLTRSFESITTTSKSESFTERRQTDGELIEKRNNNKRLSKGSSSSDPDDVSNLVHVRNSKELSTNMADWAIVNEASLVKNSIFLQNDTFDSMIDNSDSETEEDLNQSGHEEIIKNVKKNQVDVVARKLYSIVTEILTTERAYVKRLYLLDEIFRKELLKQTQEHNTFTEKVVNDIFSNLESIYQFHATILLPDIEKRITDWDNNPKIGDIFKTLGHCLKMYSEFVKNFDNGINVLNHWLKKCQKFASVVEGIQKRPECENLTLQHHLLEPIQRIPRYKLLIQDYLNKLPEDSLDREETEASLVVISKAADQANDSMKENEKFKKLLDIEERISDGLNGQTLVTASRVFIKEGDILKQAARSDNTMPRILLLFNDVLLCCAQTTTGKLNVRQVMDVAGITIETDVVTIPGNGFRVKSRQRVLDLITSDESEKNDWISAILNAVDELEAKRGRAVERLLEEDSQKGHKIGDKAPVWVKDEDVTMCMICAMKFGMVQRKHHCRGCGRIVCDKCSNYRTRLAYLGDELKRVCSVCSMKISGKSNNEVKLHVQASIRTRNSNVNSDYQGQVNWKSPGKEWKTQYVILSEFVLYIQKKRQDVKSSFTLPVPGYEINQCPPSEAPDSSHPFCIKIHVKDKKEHTYYLAVGKEEIFRRWFNHLKSAILLQKFGNEKT